MLKQAFSRSFRSLPSFLSTRWGFSHSMRIDRTAEILKNSNEFLARGIDREYIHCGTVARWRKIKQGPIRRRPRGDYESPYFLFSSGNHRGTSLFVAPVAHHISLARIFHYGEDQRKKETLGFVRRYTREKGGSLRILLAVDILPRARAASRWLLEYISVFTFTSTGDG